MTSGNELLRTKSRKIEAVDQHVRRIFADMTDTLYSIQNGGGLAACQIGILSRLVIADTGGGVLKLVNPQIVETSGEQLALEGCLSCPGIYGKVRRPARIVVTALSPYGKPFAFTATGELAKCLCHEIDHLDGILFTDKIVEYVDIKIGKTPGVK
jgi:peptide deformylase